MTDILVVQQRIIDLCQMIELPAPLNTPGAVASEEECDFQDEDLPVFEVRRGRGLRNQLIDADALQHTREYILRLFVTRLVGGAKVVPEDIAALSASCILPTIVFFAGNRGLMLDDGGIVSDSLIVQDTSDTKFSTSNDKGNTKSFSGVAFRLQVVTRHLVSLED